MASWVRKAEKHASEHLLPGERFLAGLRVHPVLTEEVATRHPRSRMMLSLPVPESPSTSSTWVAVPPEGLFLALTASRFLVFSVTRVLQRPKDLLAESPRAEVHDRLREQVLGPHRSVWTYELTDADGRRLLVESAARPDGRERAAAWERAWKATDPDRSPDVDDERA